MSGAAVAVSGADQRTRDWYLDRAGKITGSRFADAIAMTEGGFYSTGPKRGQPKPVERTKTSLSYMMELAFERTAQIPIKEITGRALDWGTDTEGAGKEAYEVTSGNTVIESPFVVHPKYSFIGVSPDGLVDDDPEGPGLIEAKCPWTESVHIRTWLKGMPEMHVAQVQGQMWVTDRQWVDFISYDPRQAAELRLFIQRIYRDEAYISELERALLRFEAELQQMVKTLQRKASGLPVQ